MTAIPVSTTPVSGFSILAKKFSALVARRDGSCRHVTTPVSMATDNHCVRLRPSPVMRKGLGLATWLYLEADRVRECRIRGNRKPTKPRIRRGHIRTNDKGPNNAQLR